MKGLGRAGVFGGQGGGTCVWEAVTVPCPTTCSAVPAPQGPTAGHSITAQFSGSLRVGAGPGRGGHLWQEKTDCRARAALAVANIISSIEPQ